MCAKKKKERGGKEKMLKVQEWKQGPPEHHREETSFNPLDAFPFEWNPSQNHLQVYIFLIFMFILTVSSSFPFNQPLWDCGQPFLFMSVPIDRCKNVIYL